MADELTCLRAILDEWTDNDETALCHTERVARSNPDRSRGLDEFALSRGDSLELSADELLYTNRYQLYQIIDH